MEHCKVLADTSIVIDHLRKSNKSSSALFKSIDEYELSISAVSVFELYAGATDERKKTDISNTLSAFETLPFTHDIAVKAGELYIALKKSNRLIEVKDIFIAATAIVYDMPVFTLNKKHFERLEGISLV
jgi:predicted nucleic acid-binding protein